MIDRVGQVWILVDSYVLPSEPILVIESVPVSKFKEDVGTIHITIDLLTGTRNDDVYEYPNCPWERLCRRL